MMVNTQLKVIFKHRRVNFTLVCLRLLDHKMPVNMETGIPPAPNDWKFTAIRLQE